MTTIRDDLLARIDRYCAERGVRPSVLGRLAVNDAAFVDRLRSGKNIGINTIAKVEAYLDAEMAKPSAAGAAA